MCDKLINDLKNRFSNCESVKVSADIEDILVSRVKGNYERCDELFSSEGYMTHALVIDTEALKSEFMCISMTVNTNEVSSLISLVKEL